MREPELLSVVALLEDSKDHKLLRGQVGTIVERLVPGVYEVEFSDDKGRTYASLPLRAVFARETAVICNFPTRSVEAIAALTDPVR